MKFLRRVMLVIMISIFIVCTIFLVSVFSFRDSAIGTLETIDGIPYPKIQDTYIVEEELAHADIFIHSSVFAKKLVVTISFDPKEVKSLDVGIRTGEFWLGYEKQGLYVQGVDAPEAQTKVLEFPLTSAFQDTNTSIDMMFFADSATPSWALTDIRTSISPVLPAFSETKNYIKSIINKEREP